MVGVVTEPGGHDVDGDAARQRHRRRRVPERVQRTGREPVVVAVLAEPLGEPRRVDVIAELVAEDEVVVPVRRSGEGALGELHVTVDAQRLNRDGVERDCAAAPGRLRRAERDAATGRDQLLLDGEACALQVQRPPGEAEQLSPPHPCGRRQPPERVQAVAADVLHEAAQLRGCPGGCARATTSGRVGHAGDVARDPRPPLRVAQRAPEHGVDEAPGGDRETRALELGVEAVQVAGRERLEPHGTDPGYDVQPDGVRDSGHG